MDSRLLHDLKKVLGAGGVLYEAEDLLLYEYDGSVEVARPDCVVFPRTPADVLEIVRLAKKKWRANRRARRGHRAFGRGAGAAWRNHRVICADEPHRQNRCGKSASGCAAGRGEFGFESGRGAHWIAFCSRSFEPEGLHDRRKRFREFWRSTYPGLRCDNKPRSWIRGCAAQRRACAARRRGAGYAWI